MHNTTVNECVAVGDINPKYPLITQPDSVCLSFENYMCIGLCCISIIPKCRCRNLGNYSARISY